MRTLSPRCEECGRPLGRGGELDLCAQCTSADDFAVMREMQIESEDEAWGWPDDDD